MAGISEDKTGLRKLQYVNAAGERKQIKLGRMPKRDAESLCGHVEKIVGAQLVGGVPPRATADWLADLPPVIRDKLVNHGLAESTKPKAADKVPELGPFIDDYILERERTGAADRSLINYRQARASLTDYFGESKDMRTITEADAGKWRRWMESTPLPAKRGRRAVKGLMPNTFNRRCGFARQFFAEAKRAKLVTENPFECLKGIAVKANRSRDFMVSTEDAVRVLAACPSTEWRLIFTLARWGGLRCPSEHSALRWGHVDFKAGKMEIHSPKTGLRVIPIFPELLHDLKAAFKDAQAAGRAAKADKVIDRDATANLGTTMNKIIRRAGVTPWPKTFQNLRLTRQTELAASFPVHVVCEWIGNSKDVAMEHYLRATDSDFTAATEPVKSPQKRTRNRTQNASVPGRMTANQCTGNRENPRKPADSVQYQYTPQECNYSENAGDFNGLEPPYSESYSVPPELVYLVNCWPDLPEAVKARILEAVTQTA